MSHPQILYHITPSANVASIEVDGIIPAASRGLSGGSSFWEETSWRWRNVWLTHDFEYILSCQAGKRWAQDATILEIDTTGLDIRRREDGPGSYLNDKGEDAEFLYEGTIPPSHIKSITKVPDSLIETIFDW